jgi:hypothetical protein
MPPLTQNQTNAIDNANITASNLENPTPTPNLPTGSTFDINQYTTPSYSQNQDLAMAKQNSDTSLNDLTTAMFGSENQGSRLLGMENSAGIPDLQNQLTDITNQINTTDLNFRRERENIQNDQTLSMAQKNSRLRDVSFKQASNLADMEVIRSARSNTLSNLQAQVQRKADLQFADEKTRIDNLKFIYDNNEGKYKDQLDEVIKKEDRAYELAKNDYEKFVNTQVQAVQNAQLNGASNADMLNIMSKKNLGEILADPSTSKFLVSPKEKLELQKMGIDIRNSNLSYEKMLNEMNEAKRYLGGTTNDPTLDIITASARYGDKRLTDTQMTKIQQATTALGSMESLQGLLGLDSTGPLKGRAKTLISEMGGEANAKAINATIQGLIPTVARGIFGEVGVLTDADINNYKKTVPNLTSSNEQNKLVSLIMYDVLSRSVKTTLTTNAQNQANVSNFASTYQDVENRISKLKADLGVVESPITEQSRVKMESAWNSTTTPQSATNTLNSFFE